MEIKRRMIKTDSDKESCYVHARGAVTPSGFGIVTMQKLLLSGSDVFYGIEMMKTSDGAKSFSKPELCKSLVRIYEENGESSVMCDATPIYHKNSGKIILTGHLAVYGEDNEIKKSPRPRDTVYAVYDEKTGAFGALKRLKMPETEKREYFSAGAGCTQIVELESGELLIPIYFKSLDEELSDNGCFSSAILRCRFDGENIEVTEVGEHLSVDIPRGLYEPSVISYRGEYFLAMRNDITGYVAKSRDGLNFEKPRELTFDDGENLGNYNTQQHWLVGGGKLWLVYTRRAGTNDHVFRHRAPLFIAQFDSENMCVIRDTEKIVVPERGARLGNFGCQSYSDNVGYVYAAEWMQNGLEGWETCAKYGSDNTVFVCEINF